MGAHGGAGTSTLAKVLGVADLGCDWPDGGQALLVARTHADGLQMASKVLNSVVNEPRRRGRLVAVALVADAPVRLPRSLNRRIQVISSAARIYRIPWIPSFRVGEEPAELPREIRKLVEFVGTLSAGTGEAR